jgi:hypothetical protein
MLATRAEYIERAFPTFDLADTLGVSRTGEIVRLTDWSRVYVLQFPRSVDAGAFADSVRGDSTIAYVELNQTTGLDGAQYPNDPQFQNGNQWSLWNYGQNGGTSNADVDAPEAWDITTGSPGMIIGVVDVGISRTPEDLAGRITGSTTVGGSHGTNVAGIIGAITNNSKGIAGILWNPVIFATITGSVVEDAQAVRDATSAGAVVLNNSWHNDSWSGTVRAAFADAYKLNRILVAAAGNTGTYFVQFPAGFPGVIGVANTDRNDERYTTSTMGPAVDLSAPGTDIETTDLGVSSYVQVTGTSFSSPHVAGAAGLLLARMPSLYNDDVEQILKRSAANLGPAGWDSAYGAGRINMRRALELIGPPNLIQHPTLAGSSYTTASVSGWFNMAFYGVAGLQDGSTYTVRRYEIWKSVINLPPYPSPPVVWGRGVGSVGFNGEEPNFGIGFCEPVYYTAGGGTFRTFVYEVQGVGWFPCQPSQVQLAYTLLLIPQPNPAMSYFVPEAGSVTSPTVGAAATALFRACPNNDGGTSLPNNARVRVVLRDGDGTPVSGVPADSIFAQFNGGTSIQGFSGVGADSIIANSQYNPAPLCPDVRYVTADAPSDSNGVTYITFAGNTPGSPGIATRDPQRKWGHYDSEIPVYADGVKLAGRLTSGDSNGSYILRIKNFDFQGGLGTPLNQGEVVSSSDINSVGNNIGVNDALSYWRDFNSSGAVTAADYNMIVGHSTHNCALPNNP